MKHAIEELGEHADEHHDGGFVIWQWRHDRRDSPQKKWGARFGVNGQDHAGATPDEAIDAAMDAHEQSRNPDPTGGTMEKRWSNHLDWNDPSWSGDRIYNNREPF